MKIILHIGKTKTASTTIQVGLKRNEKKLNQMSILFPRSCRGTQGKDHNNLSFEIQNHPHYNRSLGTSEGLVREISHAKYRKCIISSEVMYSFTPSQIERVNELLSPLGKISIIVYLRRMDQWINSHWAQIVKTGFSTESFSECLDRILLEENNIKDRWFHAKDYDKLEAWSNIFGKDNLHVIPFESEVIIEDVFHNFLRHCGIESPKSFPVPPRRNPSPSSSQLAILQSLFAHGLPNRPFNLHLVYFKLVEGFYQKKQIEPGPKVNKITPELYQKIRKHYEESDKKIAKEYLGRDNLYQDPFKAEFVTSGVVLDISNADALELSADVFKGVCQRIDEELKYHQFRSRYLALQEENEGLVSKKLLH